MNPLTQFTVLIERRTWRRIVVWLATLATALSGLAPVSAAAAPVKARKDKVAKDLQAAVSSTTTSSARWAKDVNGVRHLQVKKRHREIVAERVARLPGRCVA